MSRPPNGFPTWRAYHDNLQQNQLDTDLAAAMQQSTTIYQQQQLTRYRNGIEITVHVLPISAAPDAVISQYPNMLGSSILDDTSQYASSDYILLPKRFAREIYPDINTSSFNTGLTVFKTQNTTTNTVSYITLHGFIQGPDQEYAYLDNKVFETLNIQFGQVMQLTVIPYDKLYPGTRVILRPLAPLQFLNITDQALLLEGYLGIRHRVLYPGQSISVCAVELGGQQLDFTVNELYENNPTSLDNSNTKVAEGQVTIITDTNLEIEFRVTEDELAAYAAMHRPPTPVQDNNIHTLNKHGKRFRIKGILPDHLEKLIDDVIDRRETGEYLMEHVALSSFSGHGHVLKTKIAV